MGHFIRSETTDPVGKCDLLFGIVLSVFAVIATVPPLLLELTKVYFDRSDWTAINPVLALLALIGYFIASLKLIPPKPPIG